MTKRRKGPVSALRERVDELEQLNAEYKDKYVRAIADFDNFRKRVQRESEIACRSTMEGLMLELLPVMDNFERALAASENNASPESLHKGVDLIRRQLCETLIRHGLEQYSCLGQEFDPRRAEAVSFVHSDECEENTVVEEQSVGYRCGERVLRPARVVVAKSRPSGGEPEEEPALDSGGDTGSGESDRASAAEGQ
ncbi:MAG: nucleotide exchange factor GrpE [candidate division WOR-3 bacterium]|nr:MAG: nucleotide exchange factor GrpE [candidate division WOR-3 bacterium]